MPDSPTLIALARVSEPSLESMRREGMVHPFWTPGPLVGRSRELDQLVGLLDQITVGAGQVALIEGHAGIGKTALLQKLLGEADARGFLVFMAVAGELERDRPFGTLALALGVEPTSRDEERREIARLLGGEIAAGSPFLPLSQTPEIRFRVLDALVALVERLCLSEPAVLALENLQWADPSTLLAMEYLGRRLAHLPIALIGTLRPSPQPAELDSFLYRLLSSGGLRLLLEPLDNEAVASLVATLTGAPPAQGLLAAVADAGGNPLFVKELVSAFQREGAIEVVAGKAEVRTRVFPPSLRILILRQLGSLSLECLKLLRVGSVLGSAFSVSDLAVVLGQRSTELMSPLDEAVRAAVLGEADKRMIFRHELVREAIYSDLPEGVRVALHAQAGAALADANAPAAQVASHLVVGATRGDRKAVDWLMRAAREAALQAPDLAVGFLEHALKLIAPEDPERDHLLADLARVIFLSGRAEDAERLARETLARNHDPAIDTALRLVAARSLIAQGRMLELAEEMSGDVQDPSHSAEEQTRILAEASLARILAGVVEGTEAMANEAKDRAERGEDRIATCVSLMALCVTAHLQGRLQDAVAYAKQAAKWAESSRELDTHQPYPSLFLGISLIDADQVKEANEALRTGRIVAEQVGVPFLHSYHFGLALGWFHAGEWDDAIAEVEAGLALIEETHTRSGTVWAKSALALIALHRDDLESAGDRLNEAERDLTTMGNQYLADWLPWALALLHEARGEPMQALTVLGDAWEMCAGLGLVSEYRTLGPDLVRMLLADGNTEKAASVAGAVEDAASRGHVASLEGAALRCRGLCEGDPGVLSMSVDAYRRSPRRMEQALASEDASIAFAEVGRRQEAIALLHEALEIYEDLGAVRDLRRVDSILRRFGVSRGRRGTRRRPALGWDSLTPTEREVVRLATEGLTNSRIGERMYVSRRTVETHLSHVFAKVGVTSRVQLAVEAARRAS